MRELIVVFEDSDTNSLVLKPASATAATTAAEQAQETEPQEEQLFFIEVTAQLREFLGSQADQVATQDAAEHGDGAAGDVNKQTSADPAQADNTAESATDKTASDANSAEGEATKATQAAAGEAAKKTESGEKEQSLSAPLRISPREIQQLVRGGKSLAEVAELAGVPESRIEPYAHPVLLEREAMCENAKRAHPVREQGPATLTLFEVVATAFAARDIDMENATWDAYRDAAGQWVVRVSWRAGLRHEYAEWSYHGRGTTPQTAVPRNAIAADLIDPDFSVPVRKLHPPRPTAITRDDIPVVEDEDFDDAADFAETAGTDARGERRSAHDPHSEDAAQLGHEEETSGATATDLNAARARQRRKSALQDDSGADSAAEHTTGRNAADAQEGDQEVLLEGEPLLQHPKPKPRKSRKTVVTPPWEDVLLGVGQKSKNKRPRK